jgi:hypothetical protein
MVPKNYTRDCKLFALSEVKTATDGFREHFNTNATQMGQNLNTQKDQILLHCEITFSQVVEM